uniref:CW-type domain-containing protein n=1 Tax=Solanum lycopersicum TaxID=4081 RepID=K4C096_SOLLC
MEFAVQCSKCFKWRYIPTEERYLKQHSAYESQAVKLEKFSFKTPRSLQQDYAKKRSPTPQTP